MSLDEQFMREAFAEARRGRYSAAPNPAVGCILARGEEIIARGFHRRAGNAHAEVAALEAAGEAARGATAYVTLEPCNHSGRTGPCTEALINAGVARVVFAASDPNPEVAGGGAARLHDAGVAVTGPLPGVDDDGLNAGFRFRALKGRPRVRVKVAMSLDGRSALADGQSQWITGSAARQDVQRLRAESCAVLTGIGTVLADDPSLTVREPALDMHGRMPDRIVLDSNLRTPPAARMLTLPGVTRILTASDDDAGRGVLIDRGAVLDGVAAGDGGVDLDDVMRVLIGNGYNNVLVEAGPRVTGAFIASGLCDELIVYIAPKLLGSTARAALPVASPAQLTDALSFTLAAQWRCDDDIALRLIKNVDA